MIEANRKSYKKRKKSQNQSGTFRLEKIESIRLSLVLFFTVICTSIVIFNFG